MNARRSVNALSPTRILSVTVHLSFHAPREATREAIHRNAADFDANFAAEYAQRANVTINVCPSLEDYAGNGEFHEWARDVAAQIPGEHIGRIRLRRNPIGSEQDILAGAEMGCAGKEVELHNKINLSRHAYSNDGNLRKRSPGKLSGSVLVVVVPLIV